MPSLFSHIKTYLLVLVISVFAGFFIGKSYQQKVHEAAAYRQQVETQKKSDVSISKSNEVEKNTLDRHEEIQVKYRYITKEIVKYVPATTATTCTDEKGTHALTLSRDAVRVLNADSQPSEVQPTTDRTDEGQTATEIGLRELSEYIKTIKQQYEELANAHDGLVDYDHWYLQQVNPNPQ